MIRKWLGKGILGVGQRRGLFAFGELLILVYNSGQNKVVTVQNLRGFTIFARFVEIPAYAGLSLEELRAHGTSKRCALIQAIDAVEKHLRDSQASKPKESKAGTRRSRKNRARKNAAKASGAGPSGADLSEAKKSGHGTGGSDRPREPELFSYGDNDRVPQTEPAETVNAMNAQDDSGLKAAGNLGQESEAEGETSAG